MRTHRIHINEPLTTGKQIALNKETTHYLKTVLRIKKNNPLRVFNGHGGEFDAAITEITQTKISLQIGAFFNSDRESPLSFTLAQGICRGEKMDLTIQKSVELGVSTIIPLLTHYGNVKINEERALRKIKHWKKIILNASEQCGRNKIPNLYAPIKLDQWITNLRENDHIAIHKNQWLLTLNPNSTRTIGDLPTPVTHVTAVIGPEGGLHDDEIKLLKLNNFTDVSLGPRILRSETAALALLSAIQATHGDFL